MIRRETIDGREASVAYMDGHMFPVDDPRDADLIKIIFDDGETLWAMPSYEDDEESDEDLFDDAEDDDTAEDAWSPEDEDKHPRGKGGQFARKGEGGGRAKSEPAGPPGQGTERERADLRKQINAENDSSQRGKLIAKLADSYETALEQAVAAKNESKARTFQDRLKKLGREPKSTADIAAGMREDLAAMIDRGAAVKDISRHPLVSAAVAETRRRAKNPTVANEADYNKPEWREGRTYEIDGDSVKGTDAAVKRLIDKAKGYSTSGPVAKGQHAVIIIGPPAAGKSNIANPLAERYRAAIVDPDDAKTAIPEFANGLGAAAVHEESSLMAKEVFADLLKDGSNVVVPKVGADPDSIRRFAAALKAKGYTVDLAHVQAGTDNSQRRNIKRFLKSGRLVPPDYLAKTDSKPEKAYQKLKKDSLFHEAADFSTAGPERVRAVGG